MALKERRKSGREVYLGGDGEQFRCQEARRVSVAAPNGRGRVEPNNFPRSAGVERFLPATHKGDKRQEEGGEDRLESWEEEVGDRALGRASPPPGASRS